MAWMAAELEMKRGRPYPGKPRAEVDLLDGGRYKQGPAAAVKQHCRQRNDTREVTIP